MGVYQFFIMFVILTLSPALRSETVSRSVAETVDIGEPVVKFGAVLYDAINEEGLEQTLPNNRMKRVKLSDVRYFDILNRNREYRRQIVSPSQLPRQPKERWEKVKGTENEYKNTPSDDSGFVSKVPSSVQNTEELDVQPQIPNEEDRKSAKQLYYYGPEFLKLLGLSYTSDGSVKKDFKIPASLLRGRSIDEIMAVQNLENKVNNTNESTGGSFLSSVANAAGSQIGAALANNLLGQPTIHNSPIQNPNLSNKFPPQYLGAYPHTLDNDYDYNDDTGYTEKEDADDKEDGEKADDEEGISDNNTKKKKKKMPTKRRPNGRPPYYGQSSYPSYALPYSPYAGVQPTSPVSAGLNNQYQQHVIGNRPVIGSGLAQGQFGIGGSPGITYAGEQALSSVGSAYHQTYPSAQFPGQGISPHASPITSGYGNSGFTSPVISSFNQHGYSSPAPLSTSSYTNSGISSGYGNTGFTAPVSSNFNQPGYSSPSPHLTSSYTNSGFSSNYPSSSGYTPVTNAGSYYGSPYGRVLLDVPEARKKGSTVGKVVGGALAAGN